MRRAISRLLVALAACAVVFSHGPAASSTIAAEPQRLPPRISRRADPRIGKALAEKTDIEFVGAPLQDLADYLQDLHGIEIQLDVQALQAAGIGPCTPFTHKLKDISLEAALDIILRSHDLTWVADDEVITITTPATAQSGLTVRLYDCRWATAEQFPRLIEAIKLVDLRPQSAAKNAPGAGGVDPGKKEAASDFKLVTFEATIVVRATALEQEMIVRLLEELRASVDAKKPEPEAADKRIETQSSGTHSPRRHLPPLFDEKDLFMRRSIVRRTIAVLILMGGVAVFSRSAPPILPQAAAVLPPLTEAGEPNPLGQLTQDLINDLGRIAAPTRQPTQAPSTTGKVEVASIRAGRQPGSRISKALTETTSIEFVDAPLQDVVDFLKDRHKVEIQIDAKSLEDASIGPDSPVSCNLNGISLGTALDLLLKNLDLVYVLNGEVLLITHEDGVRNQLVVRLYDCAWARPDRLAELIELIGLVDSGRSVALPVVQEPKAEKRPASAAAFRVIPYGNWLAVRANEVEHEAVRRLLAELCTAAESEKTLPAAKGSAASAKGERTKE